MEYNIGIWWDSQNYNGRGIASEFKEDPIYMQGPVNERDVPCVGCDNYEMCKSDSTECSAFRNWASKGDYVDTDVMRFLRVMK